MVMFFERRTFKIVVSAAALVGLLSYVSPDLDPALRLLIAAVAGLAAWLVARRRPRGDSEPEGGGEA
jgi:hypothetical protein